MWEGDNILNVKCLFRREVVPKDMRLHFASKNVAFDNELKPREVLFIEKVTDELNRKMGT